ncbi:MAG TPA: hypothetical protein VM841_12110 [Actinomycetota bacterium]|nr:hypothetical protein [Actinomycetota bacterium]
MGGRLERQIRLVPNVLAVSIGRERVVVLTDPATDAATLARVVTDVCDAAGWAGRVEIVGGLRRARRPVRLPVAIPRRWTMVAGPLAAAMAMMVATLAGGVSSPRMESPSEAPRTDPRPHAAAAPPAFAPAAEPPAAAAAGPALVPADAPPIAALPRLPKRPGLARVKPLLSLGRPPAGPAVPSTPANPGPPPSQQPSQPGAAAPKPELDPKPQPRHPTPSQAPPKPVASDRDDDRDDDGDDLGDDEHDDAAEGKNKKSGKTKTAGHSEDDNKPEHAAEHGARDRDR